MLYLSLALLHYLFAYIGVGVELSFTNFAMSDRPLMLKIVILQILIPKVPKVPNPSAPIVQAQPASNPCPNPHNLAGSLRTVEIGTTRIHLQL